MDFLRRLSSRPKSIEIIRQNYLIYRAGAMNHPIAMNRAIVLNRPIVLNRAEAPDNIDEFYDITYILYKINKVPYIYYASPTTFNFPPPIRTPVNIKYDDITMDIILFGDIYNISDVTTVERLMGPNKDFYGYLEDSTELATILGWVLYEIKGVNVTQIKFIRDNEVAKIITVEPFSLDKRPPTPPR